MSFARPFTQRRVFKSWFLILCAITSLLPSQLAYADANRLIVTPSSSQMSINTTFPVNIRSYGDTDQATGTASGSITYPTSLLQVTGISTNGSAYGAPSINQGAGIITFSASRSPAPSGFAQVFSVTFRAIGAGAAAVNFSGDSKVNGSTTIYTSGVFTITNPNPPTASTTPKPSVSVQPSVTPVPVITTTPSPTPQVPEQETPQPSPDPTGVVSGVSVVPSYTSATISWTVNADQPKSTLRYGTQSSSLDKTATINTETSGAFTTTITGLSPGNRYYFAIEGSGANKNGTYSGTIITNGFPVTITVTENGIPAKSAQVKIGTTSRSTSSNGKLSLGLAAGNYSGTITTSTATLAVNFTVAAKTIPTDGQTPETQPFDFDLKSSTLEGGPGSGNSILAFIGILAGGTVILSLGFVMFMAYRRRKYEGVDDEGRVMSGPAVIIDDGYDWRHDTPDASTTKQQVPPQTPSNLPPHHNNSVYIDEEEPVDMFAKPTDQGPPTEPPR